MGDGIGIRERRFARRQGGRLLPRIPLERIAGRNRGQGVVTRGRRRGGAGGIHLNPRTNRRDLVQRLLRRGVLRRLQVGVHLIVERVELLGRRVVLAGGRGGRDVGLDRILPCAHAREGVRGHVKRMRRGRRDLRVAAGGIERARRQRRHVEAVDDVVREPRMIGLPGEFLLEDAGRLQLVGVRLVGRQRRLIQRQRVEDPRFGIVGELRRERRHLLLVFERARPLRDRGGVLEERLDGREVAPLALGLRPRGLALLDGRQARLQRLRRPEPAERIAPPAHRDTPMRHRAARVVLQNAVERLDGGGEPEGVEQRDPAIELLRDSRIAGGRKVHRAKAAGWAAVIVLVLVARTL